MRLCVVLPALAALYVFAGGSPAAAHVPRFPAVVYVHPEDATARARLFHLVKRSETMREMLRVLESAAPPIRVHLHSNATLARESGLRGRGRFSWRGRALFGVLEFDRDISRSGFAAQLRAIAHEIAHAVEVACLSPAAGPQAAAARGRQSSAIPARFRSEHAIETRFAERLGRQVVSEVRTGKRSRTLESMARTYGLGKPCFE